MCGKCYFEILTAQSEQSQKIQGCGLRSLGTPGLGRKGGGEGLHTVDDEAFHLLGADLEFALDSGEEDLLLLNGHAHERQDAHLLQVLLVRQTCRTKKTPQNDES